MPAYRSRTVVPAAVSCHCHVNVMEDTEKIAYAL
jgi:hypothetical protein